MTYFHEGVFQVSWFFLWGIFFKKYVTFARRENKIIWWLSIYEHLIWKKYHCLTNFDDRGIFAPTMLSFQRNAFLFNVLEPTIKRCWENWLEDVRSWVHFEELKMVVVIDVSLQISWKFSKNVELLHCRT